MTLHITPNEYYMQTIQVCCGFTGEVMGKSWFYIHHPQKLN